MPRSKEKNAEYQRNWYKRNKLTQIARNRAVVQRKLDWILSYKRDKSCIRCGENHIAALDFHHRDPSNKVDTIYKMIHSNRSIQSIINEVAKCDILCSNCHRKLHWENKHETGRPNW